MPATIIGIFVGLILVASPRLFNVDIIALDIRFFQVLEKNQLDNIVVGVILVFVGIAVDRATESRRSAKAIRGAQGCLEEAIVQFVETMAQALDARDQYTAGHSERVSVNSSVIAKAMGLASNDVEIIRIGGRLHDIGKIGTSDAVLQKPGKLTEDEYRLIKLHPQIGKRILEGVERFQDYLPMVELHHEDNDGGGYPYGLKGESVPLGARIVHVADVFDAITSNRAYRRAMSKEDVLAIMTNGSGKQFDPTVLAVFLGKLRQGALVQAVLEVDVGREHLPNPRNLLPCGQLGVLGQGARADDCVVSGSVGTNQVTRRL
jgi:HD-GYP domain-containing protein (c-di-GMP phosphodiesterase class II)